MYFLHMHGLVTENLARYYIKQYTLRTDNIYTQHKDKPHNSPHNTEGNFLSLWKLKI